VVRFNFISLTLIGFVTALMLTTCASPSRVVWEYYDQCARDSVHRRVLRMVRLRQDRRGNYIARKRIPDELREECARFVRRPSSCNTPSRLKALASRHFNKAGTVEFRTNTLNSVGFSRTTFTDN
jgi:hypothetical protein